MRTPWMFSNTLQHVWYCEFTKVFILKIHPVPVGGALREFLSFGLELWGHADNSRGLDRMGTWQRWLVQVTHMATGFCPENVFLKLWSFHSFVCPCSLCLFGCGVVVWHSIVALIKHLILTHLCHFDGVDPACHTFIYLRSVFCVYDVGLFRSTSVMYLYCCFV